jgi:hypothetical protein
MEPVDEDDEGASDVQRVCAMVAAATRRLTAATTVTVW